jgi:amidase
VVIENLDVAANLTALAVDIASNEFMAVRAEFKLSLNAYLADLSYSPVRSLAEVIAFNDANPVQVSLQTQLNPTFFISSLLNVGSNITKSVYCTIYSLQMYTLQISFELLNMLL